MRLWHQKLIPHLPRQQLLGQHRECCALRGAGWGRKHATVDYVFNYTPDKLIAYHYLIMNEMKRRGYNPDETWRNVNWRGNKAGKWKGWGSQAVVNKYLVKADLGGMIYSEHDDKYLEECLENLKGKGIDLYEVVDR